MESVAIGQKLSKANTAVKFTALTAIFVFAVGILAGCGGGSTTWPSSAASSTILPDAETARAETFAGFAKADRRIDPVNGFLPSAEQLLNWAEIYYPEYFPTHGSTLIDGPWLYRAYFQKNIKLGVNAGDVYVTGGEFGDGITRVGKVTDFVLAPLAVRSSSYENKNAVTIDTSFPSVWDASMDGVRGGLDSTETGFSARSLSFADFLQDGSYSVFISSARYIAAYGDKNPLRFPDAPGKAYFLKLRADGQWVDVTDRLLANPADRSTCITPSYTIVADFNNDMKPDVYVACTGIDFPVNGLWTDGQTSEQHVFLSQPDGRYKHDVLPLGRIYGHQATAFDIDADGNVDILTVDPITNRMPFVLWGNGDGTFRKDVTRFPADVAGKNIYGVMGIPIDGRFRLVLSGVTPGSYEPGLLSDYGTTVLTYQNGKFIYTADLTSSLPLTPEGYKFGVGLDHIYWNGYLYSYHVSADYKTDGIVKYRVATGEAELIYSRRINGFGEQLIEIAMRPDGTIGLFGAICTQISTPPACLIRIAS